MSPKISTLMPSSSGTARAIRLTPYRINLALVLKRWGGLGEERRSLPPSQNNQISQVSSNRNSSDDRGVEPWTLGFIQ
jgi:hypothetical protein